MGVFSKRHSYEYVKNKIESVEGYKLLSTEYTGNKQKLKIMCPIGHINQMTFNNIDSKGHRCDFCFGKQAHTFDFIKKEIEKENYKLISKNYKNIYTKLDIICSAGHKIKLNYSDFKQGCRCRICGYIKIGNLKRKPYNEVKEYIESFNYNLISKDYKNCGTKIEIMCPNNHKFMMKYNDFQQNHRCPACAKQLTTSQAEKEIVSYINLIYNGIIIENDRTQIINPKTGNMLELDICLPELSKAIEYNGIYWHSNNYVKYKDEQKQIQCKQKGIDLLVIEEQEWIQNKNFDTINKFIGG